MEITIFFRTVLFYAVFICLGLSDRVHDRIYYDVPTIVQCFRRLNGTHQIGCTSAQGGNVGVLHYISKQRDLDWLIHSGNHQPYVVLLTPQTFTHKVVSALRESSKVNGVLVIHNNTETPLQFSPDSTCPSTNFELYKNDKEYAHCRHNTWNPDGNNLLMDDIEFPIVSLQDESQVRFLIEDCYEKFNSPFHGSTPKTYPLCGAEIQAAMDAIKDTPTCINRGKTRNLNPQSFCDPLGDYNVYGFLHALPYNNSKDVIDTLKNGSVIIAAAKLDAASLFQYMVPAAHTTVAGFISLLAAAQALGQVKDTIDNNTAKPIMFAFFQGETFDYMGSARMLYDMERGQFPYSVPVNSTGIHPILPHHIGYFLELSQVAAPTGETLYAHSDPRSSQNATVKAKVNEIEFLLKEFGNEVGLNIKPSADDLPLPPASVQTFLKKLNLSGVVLTDHEKEYTNHYYNSHIDYPKNLNYTLKTNDSQTKITELATHLTNVATVFARTLYNMSTGHEYVGDGEQLEANSSMVAQMLFCFFLSPQCELFNFTVNEDAASKLPYFPYSFYVGINRLSNPVTVHTQQLLSYFIGDVANLTSSTCKNYDKDEKEKKNLTSPFFNYVWIQGPVNESSPNQERVGMCLKTTVSRSSGISPAFIDGNDLSDTEYPAWSESIWSNDNPNVRVFLIPEKRYEIQILSIGVTILVVCLPVVFIVDRRAALLFSAD